MRGAGTVERMRASNWSALTDWANASYESTRRWRSTSGATSNTSWGRV